MQFEERVPSMIKFMEQYYDEDIHVFRLRLLPHREMMMEKHMLYDDWDEYTKKDYIKHRLGAHCPIFMSIAEKVSDKEALDALFGDDQPLEDVTYKELDLNPNQVLTPLIRNDDNTASTTDTN